MAGLGSHSYTLLRASGGNPGRKCTSRFVTSVISTDVRNGISASAVGVSTESRFTDDGLHHLSGLTNLQRHSLINALITNAGVAEFQAHLPGVGVLR